MAGTHFISSEHRDGTEPQPGVCSSGCDDSSTTAFCSSENKENWLLGKWAWEVGGAAKEATTRNKSEDSCVTSHRGFQNQRSGGEPRDEPARFAVEHLEF